METVKEMETKDLENEIDELDFIDIKDLIKSEFIKPLLKNESFDPLPYRIYYLIQTLFEKFKELQESIGSDAYKVIKFEGGHSLYLKDDLTAVLTIKKVVHSRAEFEIMQGKVTEIYMDTS